MPGRRVRGSEGPAALPEPITDSVFVPPRMRGAAGAGGQGKHFRFALIPVLQSY